MYVIFESGEKIALSESSYSDFRLYEGKEVSVSEMEKLLAFVDEDQYYSYALRLLGKEIYKEKMPEEFGETPDYHSKPKQKKNFKHHHNKRKPKNGTKPNR